MFILSQTRNSCSAMAAFLHHCPFLKAAPKPALRRTGATLMSLADRCPIIARQISVSGPASLDAKLGVSSGTPKTKQLPTLDQRRLFAQSAAQVAESVSKGCPFVSSQIGMVRASPEVQEDVKEGRRKEAAVEMLQWHQSHFKGKQMFFHITSFLIFYVWTYKKGSILLKMHWTAYVSKTEIWTPDKARFKTLASFCWHIRVKGFYSRMFGDLLWSLHESKNTVGVRSYVNQDSEVCMNKPFCQGKFGVFTEVEISGSWVWETFKDRWCENSTLFLFRNLI